MKDIRTYRKNALLCLGYAFFLAFFCSPTHAKIGDSLKMATGEALNISAESFNYLINENLYIAEGMVEITYRGARLSADRVEFHELTGDALALGNVVYQEGTETFTAEHGEFNFDSDQGLVYMGNLSLEDDQYITGREIEKIGEKTYLIKHGSFTACDSDWPAWQFKSVKSKVEQGEYLQSWHTVGFVKGIPVFYFPYFFFPIKTERQTGFLVPKVGNSTTNGFTLHSEFFWAISRSQDATFGHTYYDKRGNKFDLEYRYKYSSTTEGDLAAQYIEDDIDLSKKKRVEWSHQQGLPYSIKALINIDWTSDDEFDEDFETKLDDRSSRKVSSDISLTKNFSQHTIRLLFDRVDDLSEDSDDNRADQRMPELSITSQQQQIFGSPIYIKQSTKVSRLIREGKEDEQLEFSRVDIQPTISMPLNLLGQALTITPQFNFRETYYTRNAETAANQDLDAESTHREYYTASLGVSGPKFNRIFDFGENSRVQKLKHLIEPSFSFQYKPGIDEDDLPKFDSIDRVGSEDQSRTMSYGVTQRLLLKQVTAADWEKYQTGDQEFYLDELATETKELASLSLNQSYDFEKDEENFSNITSSLNLTPFDNYNLSLSATYNIYVDSFTQTNVNFTGKLLDRLNVNAQWRRSASLKREDGDLKIDSISRFLDATTSLTLFSRLGLSYRGRFNIEEHERIEDNFGLTYNAQCWNLTGNYVEQLVNDEIDKGFNILIELKHLGKLFDFKG